MVKTGQVKQAELVLQNKDDDARLLRIQLDGAHFSVATDSLQLKGHSSARLPIDFTAPQPGTYTAQLQISLAKLFSSEAYTVELTARAGRPRLKIIPDPGAGLMLEQTAVGQQHTRTLVLTNTGPVPLTIDSLRITGATAAFGLNRHGPLELAASARTRLELRFAPQRGGDHSGRLLIHSPDLFQSLRIIPLRAQGLAPLAAISPLIAVGLDFGPVEVGYTSRRVVTLINQGAIELRVDSLQVSGQAFVLEQAGSDTLAPDQSLSIPILFKPTFPGQAVGALVVRTSDPERPVFTLNLTGDGQVRPAHIELLTGPIIDFGRIALGQTARKYLLLLNRGGSPYTVHMAWHREPGIQPNDEFAFAPDAVLLDPGQSRTVDLSFTPKEISDRRAVLLVKTPAGPQRVTLEGTGKFLQLNPTSVDFGRIAVGETANQVVELFNLGNADFTVDRITANHDAFTLFTPLGSEGQVLLPANGLRPLALHIGFSPQQRGPVAGTLKLEGFWGDGTQTLEVLLNGIGVAAEIELHPSGPLDFGHVVLGRQEARSLVATNTGDTILQVEANPLTREASVEPATFSLEPGQSTNLQVRFTPASLGERFGQILLVSNDVRDKAQAVKFKGQGVLESIDLTQVARVYANRGSRTDSLAVPWNNNPIVLKDNTKLDIAFHIDAALSQALIGRKIQIEWLELDQRYDPKGGSKQVTVDLFDDDDHLVLAEDFNLRLQEKGTKRVRLRLATTSYPGAPPQSISQIFEAGGWKWDFEAKPLASLTIRPGRSYKDRNGDTVKGNTERLILPGLAFAGWHNAENPLISGIHFTVVGDILQALSTEKSIAVSMGTAVSLYKDRVLCGLAWDIYDRRPKAQRKGSSDFVLTFKFAGLF